MPRPRHCRFVAQLPRCDYYKPRGVPLSVLQQVRLTVDELEAIRLVDLEGLYQAQAAERMNISRQTLGRILESGHKKIADALVNGKAMLIEGGAIELAESPRGGAQRQGLGGGAGGQGAGRGRCGGRVRRQRRGRA
jgi:predicted DNA-binding protein (UPF0251 family)